MSRETKTSEELGEGKPMAISIINLQYCYRRERAQLFFIKKKTTQKSKNNNYSETETVNVRLLNEDFEISFFKFFCETDSGGNHTTILDKKCGICIFLLFLLVTNEKVRGRVSLRTKILLVFAIIFK